MKTYISSSSSIGKETRINEYVRIYGATKIGHRCFIGDYTIIGHPCEEDIEEALENDWDETSKDFACQEVTTIGNNVLIQPNVLILGGVTIGNRVKIGPFVMIGKNTNIESGTQIMYHSQIYENVQIGKDCIIGGFLCDFSEIGNSVTVMGSLVHDYRYGWDDPRNLKDISPIIEDKVIVGYGSIVIGKVRIKSGTFIAAGAIVTKDTPGNCLVKGVDKYYPIDEYERCLKKDKFFREYEHK